MVTLEESQTFIFQFTTLYMVTLEEVQIFMFQFSISCYIIWITDLRHMNVKSL